MKHLMLFEAYTSYQTKLMNDLLDKGYSNLSEIDKERLRNLDKQKEPIENKPQKERPELISPKNIYDEDFPNDEFEDDIMGDLKTYTDSSESMMFELSSIGETKKYIVYLGILSCGGRKYVGYMVKNRITEEPIYKFVSENGNDEEFEPADHDLHYEFDDLMQQVFYDENINK